jgi:hypothetical protein
MKTKLVLAVLLVIFLSSTGFSQKLVYSTYVGGSAKDADMNWLKRFSIDPSGTIYFATSTYGTGFPVTDDAFGRMYNGGSAEWGEEDLAIVQFNIAQNQLKYASYFGGKSGPDFVSEVLLHKGSYYLVGNTGSKDFPVTENAYDKTFNGPEFRHSDGFISRFDGHNKLVYSTFLGTSGTDWIQNIYVTDNGEMIVVGLFKNWQEFKVTHPYWHEKSEDVVYACVIRLSASGDSVLSTTVLGPSWDVNSCRDKEGNIYVAGTTKSEHFPVTPGAYDADFNGGTDVAGGDIFVTKLNPTGEKILFSTFLGGSQEETFPMICVDAVNCIYVYGTTNSADFPNTPDASKKTFGEKLKTLFLSKLSNDGKVLLYSSFLGVNVNKSYGSGNIVAARNGDIYLCGTTNDEEYPVTPNAVQSKISGASDIFITVFDNSLSRRKFSTFLGGSKNDYAKIAVDDSGDIIGVGGSGSPDFVTTPGAYSRALNGPIDAVVFKITMK